MRFGYFLKRVLSFLVIFTFLTIQLNVALAFPIDTAHKNLATQRFEAPIEWGGWADEARIEWALLSWMMKNEIDPLTLQGEYVIPVRYTNVEGITRLDLITVRFNGTLSSLCFINGRAYSAGWIPQDPATASRTGKYRVAVVEARETEWHIVDTTVTDAMRREMRRARLEEEQERSGESDDRERARVENLLSYIDLPEQILSADPQDTAEQVEVREEIFADLRNDVLDGTVRTVQELREAVGQLLAEARGPFGLTRLRWIACRMIPKRSMRCSRCPGRQPKTILILRRFISRCSGIVSGCCVSFRHRYRDIGSKE